MINGLCENSKKNKLSQFTFLKIYFTKTFATSKIYQSIE